MRVILWYRVPSAQLQPLAETYRQISEQIADAPGLVSNEFLHSFDDPGTVVVTSEWESHRQLQDWINSPGHRHTAPIRPYLDVGRDRPYETFAVLTSFRRRPVSGRPRGA
ncbi:antibiotic biosynthesis monooxygenase family protein [Nonomuraea sp. NPDC050404]|uniref:antibiotic biosynthesis monooxygenase family protein n=1 Tax=Nonomuraea sp. NPDC050404 TaxID=3155783 RepID=UPI0033C478AC